MIQCKKATGVWKVIEHGRTVGECSVYVADTLARSWTQRAVAAMKTVQLLWKVKSIGIIVASCYQTELKVSQLVIMSNTHYLKPTRRRLHQQEHNDAKLKQ